MDGRTDGQTDNVKTVYPPTNTVCGGFKNFQTSSKEPVDRFAWNLVCNIGKMGLS